MGKYDIESIRRKLKQSMDGRKTDPDEFRPKKVEGAEKLIYRYFVLPPLVKGDKVKEGFASQDMEQFFVAHGAHWINNKPTHCPRCYLGQNEECQMCQFGFDLMKDEPNKDKRTAIAKDWMPNNQYFSNIYFPPLKINPEELRGRVMFYNAPKTVMDIYEQCLNRNAPTEEELAALIELMKESSGVEPEAHGVFFDECAAFPFQLEVKKQGRGNNYEGSKFIGKNAGKIGPIPIARIPDGDADMKAITRILSLRHDPFVKIEKPDPLKLAKIFKQLTEGDDAPSSGSGFDEDETTASDPIVSVTAVDPEEEVAPAQTKEKAKTVTEKAKTTPKPSGPTATTKPKESATKASNGSKVESPALAGEAPFEEEEVAVSDSTTDATFEDSSDEQSPEIAALLSQLGDDEE